MEHGVSILVFKQVSTALPSFVWWRALRAILLEWEKLWVGRDCHHATSSKSFFSFKKQTKRHVAPRFLCFRAKISPLRAKLRWKWNKLWESLVFSTNFIHWKTLSKLMNSINARLQERLLVFPDLSRLRSKEELRQERCTSSTDKRKITISIKKNNFDCAWTHLRQEASVIFGFPTVASFSFLLHFGDEANSVWDGRNVRCFEGDDRTKLIK